MSFRSTFVNGPAKAMLTRTLRQFGYDIRPTKSLADHSWFGLPQRPIRTVLDIGACRGGFAETILLRRFPNARIHSFEPTPDAFGVLRTRAEGSNGRIVSHNIGLGDEEGRLSFNVAVDSLPASSLLPSTALNKQSFPHAANTRQIDVEIKRLDDVAPGLEIEDELLVKIDVQGFEDRVLRGGTETIGRAVACIVEIQSAELYQGQPSFHDIYELLSGMRLRFVGCLDQEFAPNGTPLYFVAAFIRTEAL